VGILLSSVLFLKGIQEKIKIFLRYFQLLLYPWVSGPLPELPWCRKAWPVHIADSDSMRLEKGYLALKRAIWHG